MTNRKAPSADLNVRNLCIGKNFPRKFTSMACKTKSIYKPFLTNHEKFSIDAATYCVMTFFFRTLIIKYRVSPKVIYSILGCRIVSMYPHSNSNTVPKWISPSLPVVPLKLKLCRFLKAALRKQKNILLSSTFCTCNSTTK